MPTLSELAIHRARLLRRKDGFKTLGDDAGLSALDRQIIAQPAVTPEDAIAKLELACERARAGECSEVVRLIEGALNVLRN
jgi:hypothetical protein